MAYSKQDRIRIHLKGKLKAGLVKRDAQDKFDFMQSCIEQMSGDFDDDDARDVCELLWEQGGGDDDFA